MEYGSESGDNNNSNEDEAPENIYEPRERRGVWPAVVGFTVVATAMAGLGGYYFSGGANKKYEPNTAAKPAATASPFETADPQTVKTTASPNPTVTVTVSVTPSSKEKVAVAPSPTEATGTPSPSISVTESPVPIVETKTMDITTWNVYHKNDGAIDKTIETKLPSSDILALQEVGNNYDDLQKLACDACAYTLYPEKADEHTDGALLIKKNSFNQQSLTTIQTASKDPKKVDKDIYAYTADINIIKAVLTMEGTDQKVVVFAIHTPSPVEDGASGTFKTDKNAQQAVNVYKHTMDVLKAQIRAAEKDSETANGLLVVAGDSTMANNPELSESRDQSSAASVLAGLGFKSIYDAPTSNDSLEGGTFRDTENKKDVIFYKNQQTNFLSVKGEIVRNKTDTTGYEKSDHYPVRQKFVLVQTAADKPDLNVTPSPTSKPTATVKPTPTTTATTTKNK